jgi:hypothetical protein
MCDQCGGSRQHCVFHQFFFCLLMTLLLDLCITDAGLHVVIIDLVNESQYKDTGLHFLQNISHSPTMYLSSVASA